VHSGSDGDPMAATANASAHWNTAASRSDSRGLLARNRHHEDVIEEHDPADEPGARRAADDPDSRWKSLPPQIRLEDTIAAQETPPQPQAIVGSDDPFREALQAGG